MGSTILLFSYGSNMLTERLQARVSSVKPIGIGYLRQYSLRWHMHSADGSGKCDAYFTGDDNDIVWGVLYELSGSQKTTLDKFEGLGHGYSEKKVDIHTDQGIAFAVAYTAITIEADLIPYDWYKAYVVDGATEHGLPAEYIEQLRSVESIPDPDNARALENTRND